MVLIKILGINSLFELKRYAFDLESMLKKSIVMF